VVSDPEAKSIDRLARSFRAANPGIWPDTPDWEAVRNHCERQTRGKRLKVLELFALTEAVMARIKG